MKLRPIALAALILAGAPQAALAQAPRITPVLSTTQQRTCAAVNSNVVLMHRGQAVADAPPTVERQTRGLRIVEAADGLVIEQSAVGPTTDLALRVHTTADGTVTDATLAGTSIEAYAAAEPTVDLATLARTMADDIPERLLIGRSFAVGDSFYPEALRQTLIKRMAAAMGMPFAVTGTTDILYRGEVMHEGRRAWRFSGEFRSQGSGEVAGRTVAIDHVTTAEILHDVETGLVLKYDTRADTRLDVAGRLFQHQKVTDVYDCEIVPQQDRTRRTGASPQTL